MVLFLLTVMLGLYVASLTAESLVQAAETLPTDVDRLSGGRLAAAIPHPLGIWPTQPRSRAGR